MDTRVLALAVYVSGSLGLANMSMMNPLVPLWAARMGFSHGEIGVLIAAGALLPALLSVPAGAICDRWGAQRVMLLAGLGTAMTSVAYPFISEVMLFFWLQLVGGLFRNTGWLAAQAYVTQLGRQGNLTRQVGYFSFATNIGTMVGPWAVGSVADVAGFLPAFAVVGLSGAVLGLIGLFLPAAAGTTPGSPGAGGSWKQAFSLKDYLDGFRLLVYRGIQFVILASFFRLFLVGFVQSFYPVFLETRGFSPAEIGFLLSLASAVSVTTSALVIKLSAWVSKENLLILALVAGIFGLGSTPWWQSLVSYAGAIAFYGLCLGLTLPLLIDLLAAYTRPEQRGLIVGVRTTINGVAGMVSPLCLGLMAASLGLSLAFQVVGLAAGLALAGLYFYGRAHYGRRNWAPLTTDPPL
ncbi:MAG: MFS transporter [Clostridia bacterium]|nr:MAG: MFS transporter [Clostridia bacterium]